MRLIRMHYGYRCASDPHLQFHAHATYTSSRVLRGCCGPWDVRLNGRRGGHIFSTLCEAKAWARQHWRPFSFAGFNRGPLAGPNAPLLAAALQGDATAFMAFLDQAEELGQCPNRRQLLCQAIRAGMFPRSAVQAAA